MQTDAGLSQAPHVEGATQRHTVCGCVARETCATLLPVADATAMHDVFISHSSTDAKTAETLRSALSAAGFRVWDDRATEPGRRLASAIQQGIATADAVLVLVSGQQPSSSWTNAEVAAAVASEARDPRKLVIPVLVERNVELPLLLSQYQALDFSEPANREEALRRLLDVLQGAEPPFDKRRDVTLAWENITAQREALRHQASLAEYALHREEQFARNSLILSSLAAAVAVLIGVLASVAEIGTAFGAVAGVVAGVLGTLATVFFKRR